MTEDGIVARYFRAVEAGDIDGAVACFAADAVYSHPAYLPTDGSPLPPGAGRLEVRGRDAIAALLRERGDRQAFHVFTTVAREGDVVFVEGVVHRGDGVPYASYVSVARLDGDGLIRHYSAYTAAPVPGAAVGDPIG